MGRFISLLCAGLLATSAGGVPSFKALAHPGGLNKEGCHNDRKKGTYHCHRNTRATQPVPQGQAIEGDVYYRNCDAARAAGAAPIRRGQPGYRPALDRDNDGWACEPYRGKR